MNKFLFICLLVIISFTVQAQKDSAKVDTAQLFFTEVGNALTAKQFQEWSFKNLTAEKYSELLQAQQAWLQYEYAEWFKRKYKK